MGCLILALWPCLFQSCFSFSHLHSWCSSVSQPKHWKSHLQDFVTFSKPVWIGANTKISVRNTQISHFLQIENHHSEYFITLIIFILTSFFSSSKLHLFKCPLELISVKLFGRKFLSLGAWRDFGGTENFIHSRRRLWKVFSVPTAVILELCREVKWIYSKIHSSPGLAFKIPVQSFPECTAPHPALLLAKILPWIRQNPWNLCSPSWDLVLRMFGFSSGDQEGQLRSFQSILFILIQFDSFFSCPQGTESEGRETTPQIWNSWGVLFRFFFPLFLNFILIFF